MVLPDEKLLDVVKSLDLSVVKARLMRESCWDETRANTAVTEYKRFLIMSKLSDAGATVKPCKDVDEVWHTHILFTRMYHRDCETVFGRYLHHTPEAEDSDEVVSLKHYETTLKNYESLFLQPAPEMWTQSQSE